MILNCVYDNCEDLLRHFCLKKGKPGNLSIVSLTTIVLLNISLFLYSLR